MNWYNGRLQAQKGDITEFKGDAIVNAANSTLMGGGGVDGAIHTAGGREILAECLEIRETQLPGGLPPGQAVYTKAGQLPCRYIIHTVGPVWVGGKSNEAATLADCYRNCLRIAVELKIKTLAFPAISTGVYAYPPKKAAKVVWEVLSKAIADDQAPEEITLIFFAEANLQIFVETAEMLIRSGAINSDGF